METHAQSVPLASRHPPSDKTMPGHWLLAKIGERVRRPGGLKLPHHLLGEVQIGVNDRIVEFPPCPGSGAPLVHIRAAALVATKP